MRLFRSTRTVQIDQERTTTRSGQPGQFAGRCLSARPAPQLGRSYRTPPVELRLHRAAITTTLSAPILKITGADGTLLTPPIASGRTG